MKQEQIDLIVNMIFNNEKYLKFLEEEYFERLKNLSDEEKLLEIINIKKDTLKFGLNIGYTLGNAKH